MARKMDDSDSGNADLNSDTKTETLTDKPEAESVAETSSSSANDTQSAIDDIENQRQERKGRRTPGRKKKVTRGRKTESEPSEHHHSSFEPDGVPRVTVQILKGGGTIYRPMRRQRNGRVMRFERVVKLNQYGQPFQETVEVVRGGEPTYANAAVALSEGETHTLYADEVAVMLMCKHAEFIDADGDLTAEDIIEQYAPKRKNSENPDQQFVFA